ncbi:MAG: HAD-IA family hydrolase [Candidatus Lokiarchaeota archaeon]|nr:HAD-IA family hydrolase [Candidatus Lokiarchaeota archaeon]MBD3198949.1 HAD-IA family hydrolase [Candidatus Lokiarchaeota archaeon]
MDIDYYLFDLDNSLLHIPNSSEYFDKILVETLNSISKKRIPDRTERNQLWISGDDYYLLLKKWGVFDDEEFWNKFDLTDYHCRLPLIEDKKIYLYPDVIPLLHKLQKYNKNLAIVSNTAQFIVEFVLETFNLTEFFHEVFALGGGNEQEIAKPSPKGILATLNKLDYNEESSSAIMIGDSLVDIVAAKRANIYACLIKRDSQKYIDGFEEWEAPPDFIIENLEEIFNL